VRSPWHAPAWWHYSAAPHASVPPPQTPPVHTSVFVHAFPSLQAVPSALLAKLHVPSPLHVPAWWHWSGAAQLYAVPPQTPPVHTTAVVRPVASFQAVPSALLAKLHVPSPLHVPAWWHWSGAAQLYAVPPQTPPVHTSVLVHAFPSLQAVPSALLAKLHVPSPLHVPAWWHWSGAAQLYAVPPQTPPVHTSVFVQAVPSLQAVPLALLAKLHV